MKILSTEQIRKLDSFTIENEPIESIDLMERASRTFCDWFEGIFDEEAELHIFCGIGNNGGDGLAVARMLGSHYPIHVYIVRYSNSSSADFDTNLKRLQETQIPITEINDIEALKSFNLLEDSIIIDALWGSGINRPIEGLGKQVIELLNEAPHSIRVAIDSPSGLPADGPLDSVKFKADFTFCFETPRLSFMLPQSYEYVGEWACDSIGLDTDFIDTCQSPHHYFTLDDAHDLIRFRPKFSHKNSNGHCLMVAGSKGSIGAALLSSKSSLASGAGVCTLHTPKCGLIPMQTGIPEVMVSCDVHDDIVTEIPLDDKFTYGIGPGIGTSDNTCKAISDFLKQWNKPVVLDADALNILAKHPSLWDEIPEGSILTPHPGEFKRLAGDWKDDWQRLELLKDMAMQHNVVLVLKGAHTAIAKPDGEVSYNSSGNPALSTAGAGDVLTGIITGLLTQSYAPYDAARLGVYVHGLCADFYEMQYGAQRMLARQIIDMIPTAFGYVLDYEAED